MGPKARLGRFTSVAVPDAALAQTARIMHLTITSAMVGLIWPHDADAGSYSYAGLEKTKAAFWRVSNGAIRHGNPLYKQHGCNTENSPGRDLQRQHPRNPADHRGITIRSTRALTHRESRRAIFLHQRFASKGPAVRPGRTTTSS